MSIKKEWKKFTGKVEKTLDKAADDIEHALRQPRKTIREAFTTDKDKEKYAQEILNQQAALKQTLDDKEKELTAAKTELATTTNSKENAERSLAKANSEKLRLDTQLIELSTRTGLALQDKYKYQDEVETLKSSLENKEKEVQKWEARLDQIQTEILSVSDAKNSLINNLNQTKKELAAKEQELAKFKHREAVEVKFFIPPFFTSKQVEVARSERTKAMLKQAEAYSTFKTAAGVPDTKTSASSEPTKATLDTSTLDTQLGQPVIESPTAKSLFDRLRETHEEESNKLASADQDLAASSKWLPELRTIDNVLALMEATPLLRTACFDVDLFSPWCKPAVTSAITFLNSTALAQQVKSSEIFEWASEHKTENWWSVWFVGQVSLMYAGASPLHMIQYIAQYAGVKNLYPQEGHEGFSSCMKLAVFNGATMLCSTWQFSPIVAVPATLVQTESTALVCMAKENIQSTSYSYMPLIVDAVTASFMGVVMVLKWTLVVSHPLSCGLLALSTLVSIDVTAKLLPSYFNSKTEANIDANHNCIKVLPDYLACKTIDQPDTTLLIKPLDKEENAFCVLQVNECCKQDGRKICPSSTDTKAAIVLEDNQELLPDCKFIGMLPDR